MLLCYGATGALIVRRAGEDGFEVLLLSFTAAGAAIAAFDIGMTGLIKAGLSSLSAMVEYPISGFSQNRNAFTFVLLMALATALALQDRLRWRTALMAIILAGILIAGSRAGLLAVPVVIGLALRLGPAVASHPRGIRWRGGDRARTVDARQRAARGAARRLFRQPAPFNGAARHRHVPRSSFVRGRARRLHGEPA